ncbi:MAG: SpoIIE family protein phosphatase [Kiritimatiellae bacterium]|nr:SpoIIE family protein phosphatase [Kiritimatiellia bacterium]
MEKAGGPLANSADLPGKTMILVVDDEKIIRLIVCSRLKREGYLPVAVATVDEAVHVLKTHPRAFSAIISDIMLGEMDGFVFRDIVRGMDPSMPFFFMTALDPEEGSGFLKSILKDPLSFYVPKSSGTDVLLKRVQRIVASRRVERFIERQIEESRQSLKLAVHIQRSILPVCASMNERSFYSVWWQPMDMVSGDMYEVIPSGKDANVYVIGDIQGHGTSAALAMTAVQTFLKNLVHSVGVIACGPVEIANLLQNFFRENLADVSYMTALICQHNFARNEVQWLTCGAPDLIISDMGLEAWGTSDKGGLPIGLLPDTVYTSADVSTATLSKESLCIAFTDGIYELSRDKAGSDRISADMLRRLCVELAQDAVRDGTALVAASKFMHACYEFGYDKLQDDVTLFLFGPTNVPPGVYEVTMPLSPVALDKQAQDMGAWCRAAGWAEEDVGRVQLVLEETVMNVYDHGFDDVDRLHEVVGVRLARRNAGVADLTVWDYGTPVPSLSVAGGDASTAFELINRQMGNHGRGRLIVRELCCGIERKRYGSLNETIYHVKLGDYVDKE